MSEMSVDYQVWAAVREVGDPLMKDIVKRVDAPRETTEAVVMTMVHCGALRMKDDDVDHDWSYRATGRGKDIYESR